MLYPHVFTLSSHVKLSYAVNHSVLEQTSSPGGHLTLLLHGMGKLKRIGQEHNIHERRLM